MRFKKLKILKNSLHSYQRAQPSHNPIVGTSYRVTNTLTKTHSRVLIVVSPLNKMVTNSTRSVTIPDISKHKRASPDSSGSSIEIQSIPNNRAIRSKHVSFHLQANNNTDDDPVPERLNIRVDDWDPARDYHVIPEATKSWNLAMEEYRSAARDQSRLHRLKDAQINHRPDLWMYGPAPTPEHLRPVSADNINIIHESAQKILDATVDNVCNRMERSQRQGERHLTHIRHDYEDTGNNDYYIAERRLLGIVGHYRIKEKDTQAKSTADENSKCPTDAQMWSRDLAHRQVQTEDQELRSRKRNRSRSNSRTKSASRNYQAPSTSRGRAYRPRPQSRAQTRSTY